MPITKPIKQHNTNQTHKGKGALVSIVVEFDAEFVMLSSLFTELIAVFEHTTFWSFSGFSFNSNKSKSSLHFSTNFIWSSILKKFDKSLWLIVY